MLGELITFPVRVGVRATQLWLRAAEETAAVVADTTGRLIDRAISRGPAYPAARGAVPEAKPEVRMPEPPPPAAPPVPRAETPAERKPRHVSEEAELVEAVAEPGAEDGAGASLRVREPWNGYRKMKAEDVIERLGGADAAALAAIQLYESQTKDRTTVLQAVERELRISTGSGSQS